MTRIRLWLFYKTPFYGRSWFGWHPDCRKALQTAIDKGGVVHVPVGTYHTASPVPEGVYVGGNTVPMAKKDEIRKRVEELRQAVENRAGGGNEEWHSDEDIIMAEALQAIADGASDPRGIAREALCLKEIEFARWYA